MPQLGGDTTGAAQGILQDNCGGVADKWQRIGVYCIEWRAANQNSARETEPTWPVGVGAPRWAFNAGEPVLSSPAVVDGRVYFGCNDGRVRCIGAPSGEPIWQYDTSQVTFSADARVISSPALAHDRLYVGSMNLFFFCLGATERERAGGTTR